MIYEIMRKDISLAIINMEDGSVKINETLPIGLELIETNNTASIQVRIKNISNFKSWCAGRVLMMNQKHAKKICNALAISQDFNDDNRMKIALIYKCTTLQDAFWVREEGNLLKYKDVSLFQNKSSNILTPVSLRGESSIFNKPLKNWVDIGTDGTLAKSWVKENGVYYLLKQSDNCEGEILASKIGKALNIDCIVYSLEDKEKNIIKCKCFTNEDYGFLPFNVFVKQYGNKAIEYIKNKKLKVDKNKIKINKYTNYEIIDEGINIDDLYCRLR